MARRLLIDGMNVIGQRPDGWWRDREGAMRALVARLDAYAGTTGDRVTVVFDGSPPERPIEAQLVAVEFAPTGGRDAADDEIAARVEADPSATGLTVVTSDAELARRASAAGARVEAAGSFRRRLDAGLGSAER